MTQDEIIEMADKAKLGSKAHFGFVIYQTSGTKELEAFAKLVRDDYSFTHAELWLKRIDEAVKAEREACALICDAEQKKNEDRGQWMWEAKLCGIAIRARGEA